MTSHALALPHAARITVVTSRTVRTVRYGVTVRSATTTEVVTLHSTGKTLTDRGSRYVDQLAGLKMSCGQCCTDIDQVLGETRNSTSFAFGSTLAAAK